MGKLKVLVVDDSVVYRKILSVAVENTGLGSVEHTASNGMIALERLSQEHFDVVLLDVVMPEMDGITTLEAIKNKYPDIAVIMISGMGKDNAVITVKALNLGAIDFIIKPTELDSEKNLEIIKNHLQALFAQITVHTHLRTVSQVVVKEVSVEVQPKCINPPREYPQKGIWFKPELVLIASSTGGPVALETLCRELPADLPVPVLVVQHMPPEFTKVLAESLALKSLIKVIEGSEGAPINSREVVIAPGGFHMVVAKSNIHSSLVIKLLNTSVVNGVKPAADVLFNSVAEVYAGRKVLGVILTGMGSDGMEGVQKLKQHCDCYCITQNETSCIIYGMPRSVYEAGLSDEVVDLRAISGRIQQIVAGRS